MTSHDDASGPDAPDDTEQGGQVSEAGGALGSDETAVAGADAVPDKTTGSSVDHAADDDTTDDTTGA